MIPATPTAVRTCEGASDSERRSAGPSRLLCRTLADITISTPPSELKIDAPITKYFRVPILMQAASDNGSSSSCVNSPAAAHSTASGASVSPLSPGAQAAGQASALLSLDPATEDLTPRPAAPLAVCPDAPRRVGRLPPPPQVPADVLAALRGPVERQSSSSCTDCAATAGGLMQQAAAWLDVRSQGSKSSAASLLAHLAC